jgi:hypothetical protein
MALGKLGSLLKWGILGLLILMVPILMVPLGIYLGWRLGLWKQFRKAIGRFRPWLRLRQRIFALDASYSKSLREMSVGCRYYVPCGNSPFALFKKLGGYRCVSAFTIHDTSASTANYGKAVNEAIMVLGNRTSRVVITLDIHNGSQVECTVQVEEPCLRRDEGWFKTLGEDIVERWELLVEDIQSISPALKVELRRGKEILQGPFMEEEIL